MTIESVAKFLLIPFAAIISAGAQIMLKKTSQLNNWSRGWFLFLIISCGLYGISLFVYLFLLRLHPISKIYPTLTILVIVIITAYGFLIGEQVTMKHAAGLGIGLLAIYMLLSG
jgi:drug/metabolite transporter (DMT)-like permease